MDIVTITLNPALDLTTRLEAMHPGEVNLVSEANLRAAGKGINVAMVLKDLGRDVGLTGWLGEGNQQSFVSLFEERALADHFVRVAGDTRINVKISEQSGRVTDLNLPRCRKAMSAPWKRRWSDWHPTLTGSCWRAACPKGWPPITAAI